MDHEKMEHLPFKELLKSVPGLIGIQLDERPEMTLLEQDKKVEVRWYEKINTASVSWRGSLDSGNSDAFTKLANYIFGKNSEGTEEEMTSPVFLTHEGNTWTMSFYLAHKVPSPLDAEIKLGTIEAGEYLALKFSGNVHEEDIRDKFTELAQVLNDRGREADGPFIAAIYDQPFSLPFFKHNEILIKVKAIH